MVPDTLKDEVKENREKFKVKKFKCLLPVQNLAESLCASSSCKTLKVLYNLFFFHLVTLDRYGEKLKKKIP